MKVGEQRIDDPELIARRDEQTRLAFVGLQRVRRLRRRLERAHDSCSHSNHAPVLALSLRRDGGSQRVALR